MCTMYLDPIYLFPSLVDPLNTSYSNLHVYVYIPLSLLLLEAMGPQRQMTPLPVAAITGQQ